MYIIIEINYMIGVLKSCIVVHCKK